MYRNSQNLLFKIFDFYIFSNIHVALVTFCLTKITLLEFGISENETALFVFFATILSYNIIRFLRINTIKNWHNNWLIKNKKQLIILSLIALFGLAYLLFQLRFKAILVLIPFTLTIIFYVFPIEKYSLRNVVGLKIFLIAVSWAGITVLFPLIQNNITLRITDWITFTQRFLLVVVLTIPFDIRDVNYDVMSLKTLPQQFGIQKSKIIGIVFLSVFFFLAFIKPELEITSYFNLFIITTLSGGLLLKVTTNQSKYYSAFLVESIPIIWFILLWMTS